MGRAASAASCISPRTAKWASNRPYASWRTKSGVLLRRTPDLVRQEAYGLLLAHFAVRGLMHEAALAALPP